MCTWNCGTFSRDTINGPIVLVHVILSGILKRYIIKWLVRLLCRFFPLNVCWKQLFFYSMPGPSSMIARQSMSGCEVQKREIKMLVRKVSRVNWCFWFSQSLKFNFFLFLSGLYFIWQVYTASPIFGVEFETEEKVNTKLLI